MLEKQETKAEPVSNRDDPVAELIEAEVIDADATIDHNFQISDLVRIKELQKELVSLQLEFGYSPCTRIPAKHPWLNG